MTIETFVAFLPWLGAIGLFVSLAAYLATRLDDGIAKNLTKLAHRIASVAGVLVILLLAASCCGYRVTAGDVLDSLDDALRQSYSHVLGPGKNQPQQHQEHQ